MEIESLLNELNSRVVWKIESDAEYHFFIAIRINVHNDFCSEWKEVATNISFEKLLEDALNYCINNKSNG